MLPEVVILLHHHIQTQTPLSKMVVTVLLVVAGEVQLLEVILHQRVLAVLTSSGEDLPVEMVAPQWIQDRAVAVALVVLEPPEEIPTVAMAVTALRTQSQAHL